MSTFVLPPTIKLHFPLMTTDTTVENYQETSISSSSEITEANSLSSSWTSSGVLTCTGITSTAYENTTVHQQPSTSATPCVSVGDLVTGSHTFKFDRYSRRQGFEVGKYLESDTFTAGGYDWRITLYPNGKREQYKDYISLYVRLESKETDVNAVFELTLVDQSGNGKHKIQTQFGRLEEKQPFLMRHCGSQWGFGQYLKKKYLKKSGYLKDDSLVVSCVVGVLPSCTDKEPREAIISNHDQIIQPMGFFQATMESSCEDTKFLNLESAAKVIIEFGSPSQLQGLINDGDRIKFDQYLSAVDEIQKSIKSGLISGYENHGARATKTLQLVFQGILDCSISATKSDTLSSTIDSSTVTSSYSYELQGSNHTGHHELSLEQVYRLRSIVERLNFTGCLGDCIEVYRISRKSAVDARFLRFSIGMWSINDLQGLDCEEFAAKTRLWIQAANKCYNSIFPVERQYYEQIFDGVRTVTYDNCFLAIVEHVAMELNNFADAVSSISSFDYFQKLFAVLDLYKVLAASFPEIQNMFHTVAFANICDRATNTINRLATLVVKLFSSFEDTVLNERSNTPPPEGTIHSLTEYAMNYVTSISQYKELLTAIIVSRPTKSLGNQADEQFLKASDGTPLRLHMIWIMISLGINLMGKSRLYEDPSLRCLFIMNNVTYIIKTVEGSAELLEMIGKEYLSKLSKEVSQTAQDYISSIWHRVLHCLRDDGLNHKFPFYNGISKNSLKDRFKAFNSTFDEVCQTQSTLLVLDIHLRDQLQKLILSKLLPAYKTFLEKYGSHTQSERFKERYIKYSSEDLQNKVKILFSKH